MRRFLNRSTKMDFSTFREHFGALNATICWFMLHKLFTIEKYEVSAFTGKKINVVRPKLIVNETNEILKTFNFFSKKVNFFQILKIPCENSSRSCFAWKIYSTSKLFKITSNHLQDFLKVSLESSDSTLNDYETLNATISFYVKSSHLEAKRSHF